MFLKILFILGAIGFSLGDSPRSKYNDNSLPVVKTVQGALRGNVIKSRLGADIYSFRGVRFAKPPVGNLRFQAPVPLEHWKGIQNATEDGALCPQSQDDIPLPTSEDCLFLNVYTTKLPKGGDNPKRSVVVFFHPGGFFSVGGTSKIYGPQYLLDQDVVLVTTNYRLAALGFLSTEDEVLPGNYGMKDQVATLQWVKQNIAAFGGDPDSVTIAGYSAGSRSVILHMISPMSQGLFHRCIAMSASPLKEIFQKQRSLNLARRQAALLNCPTDTSQRIKDCLMQKGAEEIISTFTGLREWGFEPVLSYSPVIEPITKADRFLTDDPVKLFLSGNFTKVPLFTGTTKDEFSWKALPVIRNTSWAEDMDNNFNHVAPIAFSYERDTKRSHMISQELRKFYLKDQPITNASLDGLGKLFSDALIGFPEDRTSKIISRLNSAPVYYYRFSYPGRYSHAYRRQTNIPYGVVHHDDLIYLFYNSLSFPFFTPEDPDIIAMERETKMWANFIKTGNPTPHKSDLLENVIWQRITPENLAYLDIGLHLEMKVGLYQDRMAVWERLFPLPQSSGHHHGNVHHTKH